MVRVTGLVWYLWKRLAASLCGWIHICSPTLFFNHPLSTLPSHARCSFFVQQVVPSPLVGTTTAGAAPRLPTTTDQRHSFACGLRSLRGHAHWDHCRAGNRCHASLTPPKLPSQLQRPRGPSPHQFSTSSTCHPHLPTPTTQAARTDETRRQSP